VLVIVGVVLMLGVLAVTQLGRSSGEHAEREADCIKTFSCGSGAGGSGGGDVSSLAGKAGAGADGAAPSKGVWGTTADVAKGFFVDGLWGTVKGIGSAIAHPVDTVTGIGHAIAHPIATASAIKEGVVTAWNENPERLVGAGIFEVLTLPVAAAKGAKVVGVASKLDDVGDAARAADRLADAAKAADRGADASKAADRVADASKAAGKAPDCIGGICTAGNCFAAGTRVSTLDGDVPIDAIAEGDMVLGRDEDSGATAPRKVARVFVTPDREVLELGLESDDGAVDRLTVTPEHPFWREGQGFVPVASLAPGDAVRTAGGLARVASLTSLPTRITVYNIEVEHAHTYFVGKTAAWVHNTCAPKIGDDVLVRRSDGSVSGGRIVGPGTNGRVMVEVDTAGGVKGYKEVSAETLVRRRAIGEQVVVPRSDGSTSVATVMTRHPDGRVTVGWEQDGNLATKTVHESALKDVDPDRTLPGVRPAPPARKFGDPYVKATDGYMPDRIFSDWVPPKGIAAEGWKMHVSVSPERSYQVADRVLPLLREMEVPHKVMTDPAAYARMTGGQAGKFITIYPESPQQAAEIARALDRRIRDFKDGAPVIAGERPLGDSGMIYTRYGGFTKSTVTDPRTGREVADIRGQMSPPWVPDPFTGL